MLSYIIPSFQKSWILEVLVGAVEEQIFHIGTHI